MTRTPEAIAAKIKAWNLSDVRDLRDLLAELSACRDESCDRIDVEAYIDTTSLPSAPIPDDIDTGYPVWAVDVHGVALVGDDMRGVESLDSIRG